MSSEDLLSVNDLRVAFRAGGLSARLAGRATEIEAVSGVSFTLQRGSTSRWSANPARARRRWRARSTVFSR
ncbi:hypothetical protein [Mesorhizobium sp. M0243]|uniref:hypothetical protein n=1 Tax=Mesorhizobium sp. M0243 TaxID=2956925 RepID=UPI00333DBDA5